MPEVIHGSGISYVDRLAEEGLLDEHERRVLAASNVSDPEGLWALLTSFPSLAEREGIDYADLTHRLSIEISASSRALAAAPGAYGSDLPPFAMGAAYPASATEEAGGPAPAPPGTELTLDFLEEHTGSDLGEEAGVAACEPWPVRDQARRGTCVAFAVAAAYEQLLCAEKGILQDFSEQFLYWAIKEVIGDSWPSKDGTTLDRAREALAVEGVCEERWWPYVPAPILGKPGQGPAPAAARADASSRTRPASHYHLGSSIGGNAARVLHLLRGGRAVAISVPVFRDAASSSPGNNWVSPLGWLYGKVLDPPPTAIADGGHAVCVVGFRNDPQEPMGGHFILRNSWSVRWGRALPSPGQVASAPGYGQISASYVERFLWEAMQL